jgi:hypothetical protein
LEAKEKIVNFLSRIKFIKERVLSVEYQNYQAKDIPISKVLNCYRGNTGLTEEGIYQKILLEEQRYEVLSSSTKEDTRMGKVPICSINGKNLMCSKIRKAF